LSSDNSRYFDDQLTRAYDQTAQALLTAAAQNDNGAQGHSERVTEHCLEVGKRLGLTRDELIDLRYAASLHDIGKIGVSRSIVNKPGRLSEDEFAAMKLHTVIGIRILDRIDGLQGAIPMIKHHHERWDGDGYPDGLEGEAIPLGARIIAVAEAYDILTSTVPWRNPLAKTDATEELMICAGEQFDSHIVGVFVDYIREAERDQSAA